MQGSINYSPLVKFYLLPRFANKVLLVYCQASFHIVCGCFHDTLAGSNDYVGDGLGCKVKNIYCLAFIEKHCWGLVRWLSG